MSATKGSKERSKILYNVLTSLVNVLGNIWGSQNQFLIFLYQQIRRSLRNKINFCDVFTNSNYWVCKYQKIITTTKIIIINIYFVPSSTLSIGKNYFAKRNIDCC